MKSDTESEEMQLSELHSIIINESETSAEDQTC